MKTQLLEYQDDNATLEAYVAYHPADTPKPLVILCHAWAGRDQFVCDKAKAIADLGYVGFALDMYGKGKFGTSIEENSNLMMPLMSDRERLKHRVLLALSTARSLPEVDTNKVVVMGFCFGGLCALDLARSGADIQGAVSFHGLFEAPDVTHPIQAKILALHGHDDPMAAPDKVRAFQEEMTTAGADWQMHIYGNTQHAFTNPEANDPKLGTIYNATADKRSWTALCNFLDEVFA